MGAPLASVAVVARTVAQLWKKPIIGRYLILFTCFFQCCVSGSAFILVDCIWIRIGKTDPDPGGPKRPTKVKFLSFLSARCSLLRDEDFSCSLNVLYGGLGISKLQFLITKFFFRL
jgi:hypothetical protein